MGQHTRRQAFRPICDTIDERARSKGHYPVRSRMGKPEPKRHYCEGEPGKRSKGYFVESFTCEIAKQESAPEDFLDQWNDHHQSQEAEDDHSPVRDWLPGKDLWIEAVEARRKSEQSLRRNPDRENDKGNGAGKSYSPGRAKLILAPKPDEERAAEYRLSRVDPVLRRPKPEGTVNSSEYLAHRE